MACILTNVFFWMTKSMLRTTKSKEISLLILLPLANEVCEGYVFTGVCLSMGESLSRGLCPGGVFVQGGFCQGDPRVGGTHPTRVHSCFELFSCTFK